MRPAPTGASMSARIGARQRPNRTPASIALASGPGIAATSRPNGLKRPAATISRPTAEKGADRRGKTSSRGPGRRQQRSAGRRPGGRNRHARCEAEANAGDPHRDRQRHQTRRGLSVARADRGQPLEDDCKRRSESDEGGDDAGRRPAESRNVKSSAPAWLRIESGILRGRAKPDHVATASSARLQRKIWLKNSFVRSCCGLSKNGRGRVDLDDLAIVHEHDAIGDLPRKAHLVGHDDHCHAVLRERRSSCPAPLSPSRDRAPRSARRTA